MSDSNRLLPYVFVLVQFLCLGLIVITEPLVLDSFSLLRASIWIVLLVDLVLKLRHEEQLLASEVEGYSGYMSRTQKLLPLIF